jgi:signal transduction histidine kinase
MDRSDDALRALAESLRTVLDSTVDGICLTDERGDMIFANRPLLQFAIDLRLPLEGTVQERLLEVADRFAEPDRYRAAIGQITTGLEEPTQDEFAFADGGRVFQGFTTPVRDDDGRLIGRVWTLREVTAERVAERLKDEFIATVSHELRTPLTSIVGFLEMLLDEDAEPLSEQQRRFLEIVQRSSQRLMRQVGDLLFVSQLDSGALALDPQDCDLAALVRETVERDAAFARQREIALDVDAPAELRLRCDGERIEQVVANLLSNALKFTPAGGRVTVRVRDGDAVMIEVEDTGIGIPEAERERLFQRFFRSSLATKQAIQGSGLGLAISQAIVEAHGGTIGAEPAPGGGSLFRVELPR